MRQEIKVALNKLKDEQAKCDPPHYIVKSVHCLIALQNKAGG